MSDLVPQPLRKRDSSIWARDPHDWYVEPRWCSQRLFELETFRGDICDPACGGGNITHSAFAAGFEVTGMDVVARDPNGCTVQDWLTYEGPTFDNIVSNPPFGLCDDRATNCYPFVEQCLRLSERKVALLLPVTWLQGDRRSRWLEKTPLRRVWFISPRPSMPPGHVLAAGAAPGNGTKDFCWLVWQHDYDGAPEIRWLRRQG